MRWLAVPLIAIVLSPPAIESVPFPRGVAVPAGHVAYVSTGSQQIIGIDLRTGAELWRTASALLPVGSFEGQLVLLSRAESGALQLSFTQPAPGLPTSKSYRLDPDSARANAPASVSQVGQAMELRWDARRPQAMGNARQGGAGEIAAAAAPTTVVVDLHTGTSTTRTGEVRPLVRSSYAGVPYRRFSEWSEQPWRVGPTYVRLAAKPGESGVTVLLEPTSDGGARAHELATVREPQAYVSVDGNVIALVDARDLSQPASLFSAATADRIGALRFYPDADGLAVIDRVGYWLTSTPLGRVADEWLRAVPIGGGAEMWRVSLGQRPLPPRPGR